MSTYTTGSFVDQGTVVADDNRWTVFFNVLDNDGTKCSYDALYEWYIDDPAYCEIKGRVTLTNTGLMPMYTFLGILSPGDCAKCFFAERHRFSPPPGGRLYLVRSVTPAEMLEHLVKEEVERLVEPVPFGRLVSRVSGLTIIEEGAG